MVKSTLFCLHGNGYYCEMATLNPQDEFIKTALRLPRTLHKDVQDAAEANGRSMNAEIVARLQDSLDGKPTPDLAYLLKRLQYDIMSMEAKYYIERALAYRFANALKYVREHGEIPEWHDPGTEPLMDLVEKSLEERKDAYSIGKEVISSLSQELDNLQKLGAAAAYARNNPDARHEPDDLPKK